jgi:hypothetical protein
LAANANKAMTAQPVKMLKPTKASAARFRRRAQDYMEIAQLISNRHEAKALRQQAHEYFARAQEIELAIRESQDGDRVQLVSHPR